MPFLLWSLGMPFLLRSWPSGRHMRVYGAAPPRPRRGGRLQRRMLCFVSPPRGRGCSEGRRGCSEGRRGCSESYGKYESPPLVRPSFRQRRGPVPPAPPTRAASHLGSHGPARPARPAYRTRAALYRLAPRSCSSLVLTRIICAARPGVHGPLTVGPNGSRTPGPDSDLFLALGHVSVLIYSNCIQSQHKTVLRQSSLAAASSAPRGGP